MPPRKPRNRKAAVKISPGLKSAIRKIAGPAEEVKYIAKSWPQQQALVSVNTTAGANLYPMIPQVQQGVGAADRLGNTINPKGIRTHFAMWFPSATLMTTNIYVRLICVSSREIKDYNQATALVGGNLFLDGTGSVQDITGGTYNDNLVKNQFLPINKKSWIVHHDKVLHFARNYGFTNNDTTAGRDPTSYPPLYHRITLDTPHKAALKYDKPADTTANNFAPFWTAYAWTADGGNTTTDVYVDTRSDLYFTG